ncbi:hypothetical protein [Streptomyces sp. NPDC014733]|uniref:hypothetical protein n=1 Tax=Streptomyces sp. NPDC014733 TaxID=3364885 RepID=UPI0036F5D7A5
MQLDSLAQLLLLSREVVHLRLTGGLFILLVLDHGHPIVGNFPYSHGRSLVPVGFCHQGARLTCEFATPDTVK